MQKQFYLLTLVGLGLLALISVAAISSTDDGLIVRLLARQPASRYGGSQDESSPATTPVLFWHGMGDTAYGSINTYRLALQQKYPGMEVFSVQIGNSTSEDQFGGYFGNANTQIELTCREILANQVIKAHGSLNAVGFSQGAQFLRALVQRCPLRENGIRVKNLISLGGQHQGVFGLPKCNLPKFCHLIRRLLSRAAYEDSVQSRLVQAEYWHDPNREHDYREKSIFLADINNEKKVDKTYRDNLVAMDNLVLVAFLSDEFIVPRESSTFGFYALGQTARIVPMEESDLYLEDRIGLRELNESGRLRTISIPGRHLQFSMRWFLDEIASVYLHN